MLALLAWGCATQREIISEKPLHETRLFVTRSGETVNLSWDSQPDLAYTVLYNTAHSARSPWNVLPGFDFIRGTGRTLSYTDRVPVGQERYYRLRAQPAVGM